MSVGREGVWVAVGREGFRGLWGRRREARSLGGCGEGEGKSGVWVAVGREGVRAVGKEKGSQGFGGLWGSQEFGVLGEGVWGCGE